MLYFYKVYHYAKLGLGESVVARLSNKLLNSFSFNLTFDNLFTSLSSLNHFSGNEIDGTDTLRANRNVHCPIKNLKVTSNEKLRFKLAIS